MWAKWFRLNRWIRAAIVYPVYTAVVFGINVVFHTPILPNVVMLPLVVILISILPNYPRKEDPDSTHKK